MDIKKDLDEINYYLTQCDKSEEQTQFYRACIIAKNALIELQKLQQNTNT
jgi:hypothetical protein